MGVFFRRTLYLTIYPKWIGASDSKRYDL